MVKSKGIRTLFSWLLRLGLPLYIYFFYSHQFVSLNLTDFSDLVLLLALILSVLLFVGGFLRGETLTRVSAVIFLIVVIIDLFKGEPLMSWVFPIFVSLYFWIYGNNA